MPVICKHCQKTFETEESLQQHFQARHATDISSKKKKMYKRHLLLATLLVALFIIGYSIFNLMQKPGGYDTFAQCLTEKGATVYGNDACQYTTRQLNFFGNSKKFVNYIKCSHNKELCDSKNVQITPTWEINGETYEGVQTFQQLSSLTGCSLDEK